MNNDRKNIDQLFEEHMKGFREATPVYAWDKLDKQLQKNKAGKAFVFYRWLAASVLILLAFGAGFLVATYQKDNSDFVDNSTPDVIENVVPYNQEIIQKEKPLTENKHKFFKEEKIDELSIEISGKLEISEPKELITQSGIPQHSNIPISKAERFQKMNPKHNVVVQNIQDYHEVNLLSYYSYTDFSYKYETEIYDINDPYYNSSDFLIKPNMEIEKSKWLVGAQVAPIVSYRDISTTYSNPGTENEDYLNSVEENMLSMGGGIDIGYAIGKKWNIQSGFYYSQIGQINNDPLTFKHESNQYILISISTSTGDIILDRKNIPAEINQMPDTKDTIDVLNSLNVRVVQNFDLFEIPLIFRYKLLDKKFSVNLAGGLSPAIVVNNNIYLEADNKQYAVGNPNNLNPFIINSSFSMGLEYSISTSFSVNFEPTLKYSLSPINKDSKFNYHPYSVSWFTGLRYRF